MDEKNDEPYQSEGSPEKSDSEIIQETEESFVEDDSPIEEEPVVEEEPAVEEEPIVEDKPGEGEETITKEEPVIEATPPVEDKVSAAGEPEIPPESVPERPSGSAPHKEVVIIKEVEKKPSPLVRKITRTLLGIVLVIILIFAGTFYAWTAGMNDLRDDTDYLVVVVYNNLPKAASIYHTDTKQSEVVAVAELGDLSNLKKYMENAEKKYGRLDRMIIIEMDTLEQLSTDDYIYYEDTNDKIYVDDMYKWLIGTEYPPSNIMGDDNPAVVSAKILRSWINHYSDRLLTGYGGYTAKVVLNAYRGNRIRVYPGNSALTILRYVAIEKLVLPV